MKFSAVSVALAALPLALGGLIGEPIAARNEHIVEVAQQQQKGNQDDQKNQNAQQLANVIQLQGNQHAVIQEVIILWINSGAGAATSVINAAVTTAAAAAAAATHTVCYHFISLFQSPLLTSAGCCWW
jgi:Na+/glutamate symporter